ncbi:MAG: hypothetical protein KDA84_10005, partial [Planctomycetaceae bacterium]|nr:hypothetical protein [Planctomycetaceae bacterium]
MLLTNWLKHLFCTRFSYQARRSFRRHQTRRQINPQNGHVDILEARLLLTTIMVTNSNDVDNYTGSTIDDLNANNGGDGISLREAIRAANNTSGADAITFAGDLDGSTIHLGGELQIREDLTITGSEANLLTVSGDGKSRVFTIVADITVGISGVTIAAGKADFGGGINNHGDLTVTSVMFVGNTATNDGGGIYNDTDPDTSTATVTVTNSMFSSNSATNSGGGIYNGSGTITTSGNTFSTNIASGSGFGAGSGGGGVFN